MLSPAGNAASTYIQFQFFPIFSAKGLTKLQLNRNYWKAVKAATLFFLLQHAKMISAVREQKLEEKTT